MSGSLKGKQAYAVGSRVEAKVKGWKKHYPGVIKSYDAESNSYTIVFDDGDEKSAVKGFNIKGDSKSAQTYTSPDGKSFSSKSEYRKYMSETFYSFKDVTEKRLVKKTPEIAGQGFSISNLSKCEVLLMDFCEQVFVDNVTDSKIVVGPTVGSVFVRGCTGCEVYVVAKQVRVRDCKDTLFSMHSKTEPVVEMSTGLKIAPYMVWYPGQTELFKKANLEPELNHWSNIFDFSKGNSTYPEPHYTVLPPEEWPKKWEIQSEGDNTLPLENPSTTKAATVVPKESGFAIGMSQEDAQKAFDQQQIQMPAPPAVQAAPPPVEAAVKGPLSPEQLSGLSKDSVVLIVAGDKQAGDVLPLVSQLGQAGLDVAVSSSSSIKVDSTQVLQVTLDGEDWVSKTKSTFAGKKFQTVVVLSTLQKDSSLLELGAELWGKHVETYVKSLQLVVPHLEAKGTTIYIENGALSEFLVSKLSAQLSEITVKSL